MFRVLPMVGALLIAAATLLVLLWAGQRSLLYLPLGSVLPPAEAGVAGADEFFVRTSDGLSLGAWLLRTDRRPPLATVIVINGNAGNRSHRAPLAKRLADAGLDVCLFDYRGYGGNAGAPSEEGLLRDARAVHAAVAGRPGIDPHRIILMGESLGTGVALSAARDVAGLATERWERPSGRPRPPRAVAEASFGASRDGIGPQSVFLQRLVGPAERLSESSLSLVAISKSLVGQSQKEPNVRKRWLVTCAGFSPQRVCIRQATD